MAVRLASNAILYRITGDILSANSAYTMTGYVRIPTDNNRDNAIFLLYTEVYSVYEYFGTDSDGTTSKVSTNAGGVVVDTGDPFPIGSGDEDWFSFVARRSATNGILTLHVNGDEWLSVASDATGRSANVEMIIGVLPTVGFTDLDLAYVRLFDAALTDEEADAELASATPVNTDDLWGNYPFPDSAALLEDASGNDRHWSFSETPVFIADPELPGGGVSIPVIVHHLRQQGIA